MARRRGKRFTQVTLYVVSAIVALSMVLSLVGPILFRTPPPRTPTPLPTWTPWPTPTVTETPTGEVVGPPTAAVPLPPTATPSS